MSTTLPLFWHLSSASKDERLDASVKLITALEHFQAQFAPKPPADAEDSSENEDEDEQAEKGDGLDELNAQDVSYSVRRLVRGLASPRESSRLGFAVALTELLSKINTITCSQIVSIVLDSSKTVGSMTGQEDRDMLFARLFGLTSVIQSGLLTRQTPLPSSSVPPSSLASYNEVIDALLTLGEKKSWLRESAWWTVGLAVDALHKASLNDCTWRDDAVRATLDTIYKDESRKGWTPEKVGLTLKLRALFPAHDWTALLQPTFKSADVLSTANLATLAKILKETEDEESDVAAATGAWKAQVHWVWDVILDELVPPTSAPNTCFPDFFRIVVDESLFAATASPERKLHGFQVFSKALARLTSAPSSASTPAAFSALFTRNFMRCFVNHLAQPDRYLHKAARTLAAELHATVHAHPRVGLALVLQLTGAHGNANFDRLTKTKTVEGVLGAMDAGGIAEYVAYLLAQQDDGDGRRMWIADQLAALVRNGAVPKSDAWVLRALEWLVVHGLFSIQKKSSKSAIEALRTVPSPPFSDELRKVCRERLTRCLADLATRAAPTASGEKRTGTASDGEFWISKTLNTIAVLRADTKHVEFVAELDEEATNALEQVTEVANGADKISGDHVEVARGSRVLLEALMLRELCAAADGESGDVQQLQGCTDAMRRLLVPKTSKKKSKKAGKDKEKAAADEELEPIDVLVDAIIGLLETSTAFSRAIANQSFGMLSGAVRDSTMDLVLTQLERRDPTAEDDEDVEMGDEEGEEEGGEDASASEGSDEEEEEEEEEEIGDEEMDPELRAKLEKALGVVGDGDSDEEEEEEVMDDEQMMAIDDQLAEIFRSRTHDKKKGADAQREATHFKNRVLDLVDIFLKAQPASPLIIRTILPLIALIVGTGQDEKQLSDKVHGLLRNRLAKLKETPATIDAESATQALQEVHARARKVHSSPVLSTVSQCSVYLSRALVHHDAEAAVLREYKDSLADFATRKASPFNHAFFLDFIRRCPGTAWKLGDALLEYQAQATNTYRQCQIFQLVQPMISQQPADRKTETMAFLKALAAALNVTLSSACDETPTLTANPMKDLFKLALVAVRQTKRVTSTADDMASVWDPAAWQSLQTKLAGKDRFKASKSLLNMCKQIVQIAQGSDAASPKKAKAKAAKGGSSKPEKRKAAEGLDEAKGKKKSKKPKKAED